jgi:hypothetical protein
MTIQEAIKSGKKFKRAGWDLWYLHEGGTLRPSSITYAAVYSVKIEDILADDWEIKTEVVAFPIVVETQVPPDPFGCMYMGDIQKIYEDHPGRKIRITVEAIGEG